jgi:hypothetical protein
MGKEYSARNHFPAHDDPAPFSPTPNQRYTAVHLNNKQWQEPFHGGEKRGHSEFREVTNPKPFRDA